jgi:hypothetical protein
MSAGKKNVYTCPQGHETVTVDLVDGTTPFMISCRTPGCGATAQSSFYGVDQARDALWEWYRPDDTEKGGLAAAMRKHVEMGGLLLREHAELGGQLGEEPCPEAKLVWGPARPNYQSATTLVPEERPVVGFRRSSIPTFDPSLKPLPRYQPCLDCQKPTRGRFCQPCLAAQAARAALPRSET